ncbi:MAG: threonine--tRNA ligase, partial [Candidatus Nealsonbacteria bacterium]
MKLETIRHSLSHILAHAIQDLYPKIKFGIGPAIENGFYYDFDNLKISDSDLPKIEKKMRELIKQNIEFKKKNISKIEAKNLFKNQPYKLELIKELAESSSPQISIYESNGFVDLCAGPHIKSTKEIQSNSFKLTKTAGAYWAGDEKNKMLTRIYGIAFKTKNQLEEYLELQKEAEQRDHRVLGKKLDLFTFSDLVGKGLPLFTEKGSTIRRELERFIVDEEIKRGYKHVYTPELAKVELYKTSGHYPYYKDTMYPIMKVDDDELILRPMTCPHHFQLYSDKPRSYKELPYRIAELAKQFRYEKSGELSGLIRARSFCLADSHIICEKDSAINEIDKVLNLIEYIASILGLKIGINYRYRLSLGDRKDTKKYYKDDKSWNLAEEVLRKVLKKRKSPFIEAKKEAAFYGPKIDIQIKNFSGKEDTAFTVQYDFVSPKRFNLSYIDKDGKKKEPIVIHRSSIGALERTIAFLIEHYKGAFPLWLSPVQIWIIPISEKHQKYAKEISEKFKSLNIRLEIKNEAETMSKKIREGEMQKIPYILIVGDKEIKEKSVGVRKREKGDIGMIKIDKFIEQIQKEIKNKK